MLIVVKVKKFDKEMIKKMEDCEDITITGEAVSVYFKNDYMDKLEEKAKKYDELIGNDDEYKQ